MYLQLLADFTRTPVSRLLSLQNAHFGKGPFYTKKDEIRRTRGGKKFPISSLVMLLLSIFHSPSPGNKEYELGISVIRISVLVLDSSLTRKHGSRRLLSSIFLDPRSRLRYVFSSLSERVSHCINKHFRHQGFLWVLFQGISLPSSSIENEVFT